MNDVAFWMLLMLAQFSDCASTACALRPAYERATAPWQLDESALEDVAAIGDRNVLALARTAKPDVVSDIYVLIRFDPDGDATDLSSLQVRFSLIGCRVFANGDRWWTAVLGVHGDRRGTMFLTGSESSPGEQTFVEHRTGRSALFVPVPGDTPSALHIFARRDDRVAIEDRVEIMEILPVGVIRSWTLSADPRKTMTSASWAAERLPDGRIALVSVEGSQQERVTLRILSGDKGQTAVDETDLSHGTRHHGIALAVQDGHLAIAACDLSARRGIHAVVVDPDAGHSPKWREVMTESEQGSHGHEVRVVAASGGFVVAWIGREGDEEILRARYLSISGDVGESMDVGRSVLRPSERVAFSLTVDAAGPRFLWRDRDSFVMRRALIPFEEFARANRLLDWLCPRLNERDSHPR